MPDRQSDTLSVSGPHRADKALLLLPALALVAAALMFAGGAHLPGVVGACGAAVSGVVVWKAVTR